jgi:hypothetical protein
MGSSFGIKVLNVPDTHILKEITFNNRRFVEYIYYITKINKFYIENVKRNMIMNEFTILNILTKKEYSVIIERVEIGYFMDGLVYKTEDIPEITKLILISNVIEDSVAMREGIVPGKTLLLGNSDVYFNSLSDIEKYIIDKKAEFVFFNFDEDKVFKVNFENYRNEKGELSLGFECEEIKIEAFNKIIEDKEHKILGGNTGLFEFTENKIINTDEKLQQKEYKEENKVSNNALLQNAELNNNTKLDERRPDEISATDEKQPNKLVSNQKNKPNGDESNLTLQTDNPFLNTETETITHNNNPFDNDDESYNNNYIITNNHKVEDTKIVTKNIDTCSQTLEQEHNTIKAPNNNNHTIEYSVTGYYLTGNETYTTSHTVLKISELDKNTIYVI